MWDTQDIYSDIDKFLLKTNKLDVSSLDGLFLRERIITTLATNVLQQKPLSGSFDYQYLKDIHKHLFKDIYEWAGQDRFEVGFLEVLHKQETSFCDGKYLPLKSKELFDDLAKQNYLKDSKNLDDFTKRITVFAKNLNYLHPFCDGNGRTQRIFLNDLAKNAGYKLDLNLIPRDKMIAASIDASNLKLGKLEALIKANLKSFKQNLDLPQNQGFSF